MKQIIVVRDDLNLSPTDFAAQVAHASTAFLTKWIKHHYCLGYVSGYFSEDIYDHWLNDSVTRIIYKAKTKEELLRIIDKAKNLGLHKSKDYFLIYNNSSESSVLSSIGFRPTEDEMVSQILEE